MDADDVAVFCRALWRGEAKVVARLVGRVDPNGRDRWGHGPLTMGAQYGDLEVVAQLVRRGAAVDQGRTYLTPMTIAARRGGREIAEYLRGQGAKASVVTAIFLHDGKGVKRELKRVPVDQRDEEGTPLLHHAAEALDVQIAALLLGRGAKLGDADANGETALHRVADLRRTDCAEGARAMAEFLLGKGADVDARNWDDVTPLHQAVRARNLAVVEVLLKRGADVNARDKSRGSTPLRRAVCGTGASGTAGKAEVMAPLTRMLLAHGADPEARDKRGVPVRASGRRAEVRQLLVEYKGRRKGTLDGVDAR